MKQCFEYADSIDIELNFKKKIFVIRTHSKPLSNNAELYLSHKKDKIISARSPARDPVFMQ